MGKLIYDGGIRIDIDDRVLAHLQVVIGSKLRRGEPFYFSWRDDPSLGEGRTTIWLNEQSSLVYKYFGARQHKLNPAWIDALAFTANSTSGLYIVPEPPHEDAFSYDLPHEME